MGPQYTIVRAFMMTTPTWYKLGTLTLADALAVSMFTLELTTQSPIGDFHVAVVRFSSNGGNFVRNTYDTTPVAFNAYVQAQTTSKNWFYDMSSDLAVTQLSNSSYAFYLKVYPDVGAGFFSVQHASGDSFTYEGLYTSTTRPAQGVHPTILAVATPDGIGALPVVNPSMANPSVQGTLSCQNVTASGTLGVTGATTLAGTTASTLTVNGATSLQNATVSGTLGVTGVTTLGATNMTGLLNCLNVAGTNLIASSGFTSLYGTFSATTTFGSLTNVAGRRGFLFLDGVSPINSSVLVYFSCMSTNPMFSRVAQQGNVYNFDGNTGAAFTGTMMINVGILTTGVLRVVATTSGTINWAIVYFPNTV
jgi:hypothetical protein